MGCLRKVSKIGWLLVMGAACGTVAQAQMPTYQIGRAPTRDEVRAIDISISPEGKELPPGRGTAKEGAPLYAKKCAACHGKTASEGGNSGDPARPFAPPLVGGKGTLTSPNPVRTIESYWPFATTVWDYLNRAMPRKQEGTLTSDEVYALTAFLLYRSGVIKEDEVMDAKSLPKVQMPNRNGFIPARPEDIRLPRCRLGTCP
jgi:mono/diheme cytochrome c family protein